MQNYQWLVYALLGALAAGFIPIFAKIGMADIDSTLATTVRSIVMTLILVIVCTASRVWSKLPTIQSKHLGLIFLSGLAGAISWLFYFKAIKLGEVSKVAPIDKLSMPLGIVLVALTLRERPSIINWIGILIIAGGAFLATLPEKV